MATQVNLPTRHQLRERVSEARMRSDALFNLVRESSLYERPIPERHRIVFYIGHLEAFDWNLLRERVLGTRSFHPEFDRLFAFGIDPVGGGLPTDQPSDWPSLDAVQDYVIRVRAAIDEKLASGLLDTRTNKSSTESVSTLLNVAIEHRLMHLETLSYMLHQLPFHKKVRQTRPSQVLAPPVDPRMIEIPTGTAILGLSRNDSQFGWDNEYDEHKVSVPAFEIDQYMVTNRQYLEFMKAGGYQEQSYWTEDDWAWKTAHDVSHPVFWEKAGSNWLYLSMFDELPLPLDCPVYVSHAEASAYARWAGKSLPSEAEWHRATYGIHGENGRAYPWGNEAPDSTRGNFDFERWDPVPVNAFPSGQSAFGVHGLLGNGWEWTATVFAPFAGFEPFSFYSGYSADFFDGKHFVMKGGSARTAACMLRPTFRNWFQAHYQYVYAGFRCVSR